MTDEDKAKTLGAQARASMRRAGRATLGTSLARDGSARPYVSLVLATLDHDASPLLLLSDLADHAANLKADPRAAVLFEAPGGTGDPLARPRASILGTVRDISAKDVQTRLMARVVARHPSARTYAGFADFRLYRLDLESAHLVAGFGKVHWLKREDVRFDVEEYGALAEAEAGIVAHMNRDRADAVRSIAAALGKSAGDAAAPWNVIGIDPEGVDLRAGDRLERADFPRPVHDAEAARAALADLTRAASGATPGTARSK